MDAMGVSRGFDPRDGRKEKTHSRESNFGAISSAGDRGIRDLARPGRDFSCTFAACPSRMDCRIFEASKSKIIFPALCLQIDWKPTRMEHGGPTTPYMPQYFHLASSLEEDFKDCPKYRLKVPFPNEEGGEVKKILIVDDEPLVRSLLEMTTRRKGWTILYAENGPEALAVAQEQNPELVVMDIMMPGDIDGIQATRLLKTNPVTSRSRVIILSGKCGGEIRKEAELAGADGFFRKPFSPLQLLRAMDMILEEDSLGGSR
jgi:two-component system, OmpR family, phosphate regulon response regulator PhoB